MAFPQRADSGIVRGMSDCLTQHVPVLPLEIRQLLAPPVGGTIVDGTAGGGGHLRLFLDEVGPSGQILAIDRDPEAIARLEAVFPQANVQLHCASYAELPQILAQGPIGAVDAILLDLGLSSDQLADPTRGFSFQVDGPLDLRFNPRFGEPAWQLIERLRAEELADLIYQYGEERFSRRIARAIVQARQVEPIRSSSQFAQIVRKSMPRRNRKERIDPATRTFQALRIAVNQELRELETALQCLPDCLVEGGRLAVISFHSLEDRLVKQAFRGDPRWKALTKKPIRPSGEEMQRNPRSRSAKLRGALRTETANAVRKESR